MPDTEHLQRLERELARSRRLIEASYALHSTLDVGKLLGLILEAAKYGVDADRGTVFLVTEDRTELWSRVLTGDGDLEIRQPVGQGISGQVAVTGETVRISDARSDDRWDPSWDAKTGYDTRQLLTAPIRGRDGKVVGVFQLLNKRNGNFDEEDEAYLAALSVHAALAVENARLHRSALEKERQDREILLVQNVQRAYQPEKDWIRRGGLVAAGMNELCEDASGDYYDFIDLPSKRLGVVIGDVSGHGLGAALVMAQARAFLRAFATTVGDLPRVMQLLNDFLARDMTGGRFMTLFVGLADPVSGDVEWSSAGHCPGLLYRAADQSVKLLESCGLVMGVLAGGDYAAPDPVHLDTGDVLLLYTDGATEARNPDGDMLEEEGLIDLLRGLTDRAPADIIDGIRTGLHDWTSEEGFRDDLTLVVLKREDL